MTVSYVPLTSWSPGSQVKTTDLYPGVDTTDVTQSPQGTSHKYTIQQLSDYIFINMVSQRPSCRLTTTGSNLNATYNNGLAGVGATLTNAGALVTLSLDGKTVNVGDRVLIKDQATQTQNGIYQVIQQGSGTQVWQLQRTTDYDNHVAGIVAPGTFTLIFGGGTLSGKIYYLTNVGTVTIGTTNLIFAVVS